VQVTGLRFEEPGGETLPVFLDKEAFFRYAVFILLKRRDLL